ncbi:MAG: NOL1/NOP2/sun family putative RNA methylase [Candidatus Methanofastidiosia archaeon]
MDSCRGYKAEFYSRYEKFFGKDFRNFLRYQDMPLKKSIRTNTLKTTSIQLERLLSRKEFRFKKIGDFDGFIIQKEPYSISSLPEHLFGYFYIQGVAEMAVVPQLAPKKGEFVWDMCAAPGGKTTHLSQAMEDKGVIVATDVSDEKIVALKNNVARLGVKNTIIVKKDARTFNISKKFDKILLDAPCTGSGIIRKDPTRKVSRNLSDIFFMQAIQKGLIKKAIDAVKRGGTVLYSTCSLEPEENEFVIDWAIRNLSVEVSPLKKSFLKFSPAFTKSFGRGISHEIGACARIHPYVNDTTGMFIAKIIKK